MEGSSRGLNYWYPSSVPCAGQVGPWDQGDSLDRELQALVVGCIGLTCMVMVWRGYGCVPILSTAGPSQREEDWAANSWESSQSFSSWQEGEVLVAQSCLTLCNHMDCSLPGSSVHGIPQARKLE